MIVKNDSLCFSEKDQSFMREAIIEAQKAEQCGEVPVGCIIVHDGAIIGRGHNQVIQKKDASAHAEIVAIRQAGQTQKNYRLTEASLFVTLEPCLMCIGAIFHTRIQRLIFATKDPKTGACGGSDTNMLTCTHNNHLASVEHGLYKEECSYMLTNFFRHKRIAIK